MPNSSDEKEEHSAKTMQIFNSIFSGGLDIEDILPQKSLAIKLKQEDAPNYYK